MANPYSNHAEFTFTRQPIEQFAELAAAKEAQYQKAQLAAAELMGNFNVKEGLLTPGLANRKNKEYSDSLLQIQDSLLTNKDSMQAAVALTKLASQYKTDPEVLAGQTDYEMTPKALEFEVNNQGGHFGYRDQAGNPIPLSKLTSAEVMNAYSKVTGAPTFVEEDKLLQAMTPEEWTTLSQFKPIQTETGEIFYTNGSTHYSVKDFATMFPTLKNVLSDNFKNRNTAAANYYNVSGRGEAAYILDTFERAGLFEVHKQKADMNYQASSLNPYIAKSAAGGGEEDGSVQIEWDKNSGGFIAAPAIVNPNGVNEQRAKVFDLQNKIDQLKTAGKTQEAEGLEKELNSTISSLALYDAAYNEFLSSDNGQKFVKSLYTKFEADENILNTAYNGQQVINSALQKAGYETLNPENFFTKEKLNDVISNFDNPNSIYGVAGQALGQYLSELGYNMKDPGTRNQALKDFFYSSDKKVKIDTEIAKATKEYIGSDVVNEIQEFVPANAPKDFYDQMHQAVRNSANLFDYSGTEIISGDGEGFHKLNWGSSEIKKQNISALLAAGLTDDEMRSMRFQTQADGAYISLVLNRAFVDKETDFSSTGIQDEFTLKDNTKEDPNGKLVVRLKLDKNEIKRDLLERGELKSSLFRTLQLAEGHTSILNSGDGGFKHASQLQGFGKSVITQMFSPQITNYRTNYAEQFKEAAEIHAVLNGVRGDSQILNNEVIKGKPIRVGDQMGVRLETGRGDATEAFTIQDYTNELGSQLVDRNQQYDKEILIPNYINSILLSDIKSNGKNQGGGFNVPYGQPIKDKQAVANLIDNYIYTHPQFTLNDLNNYLGDYIDIGSVLSSSHTFGNSEDLNSYIFRGVADQGKKSQPQGSANPLGIR